MLQCLTFCFFALDHKVRVYKKYTKIFLKVVFLAMKNVWMCHNTNNRRALLSRCLGELQQVLNPDYRQCILYSYCGYFYSSADLGHGWKALQSRKTCTIIRLLMTCILKLLSKQIWINVCVPWSLLSLSASSSLWSRCSNNESLST